MNDAGIEAIRFAEFELDPVRRRLTRNGDLLNINSRAFDLLSYLTSNAGRIVSKDEILDSVWAGQFVEETNLKVQVSAIRKALGENKDDPRFVVTVPGKGYGFVGKIERPENSRLENADEPKVATEALELEKDDDSGQSGVRPRRTAIFAIGFILLASVGIILYWIISARSIVSPSASSLSAITFTRLSNLGWVSASSISADGKFVAYVQNRQNGTGSLYVRQTDTNTESRLLPPGDRVFGSTAFSPNGSFVYYIVYDNENPAGALYRIPVLGGRPTKVIDKVKMMFGLSPDGRSASFFKSGSTPGSTSLHVADLESGVEEAILSRPESEMRFEHSTAWSPDGKKIALAGIDVGSGEKRKFIFTVDLETKQIDRISQETFTSVGKLAWFADGGTIAFVAARPRVGNQIFLLDVRNGGVRQVTTELNAYGNYGMGISADGSALVVDLVENSSRLWSIDAGGKTADATQLTQGDRDGNLGLASLPNGQIVYTARTGDNFDIWTTGANSGRQVVSPIISDGFVESEIVASPDGQTLVFVSDRSNPKQLFRMDLDGSNLRQLTFGASAAGAPDISPDGSMIIFGSQGTLWKIPSSGGEPVQATGFECVAPSFSPDGKQIACIVPSDSIIRNATLAIIALEGGTLIKTFDVIPFAWNYHPVRWTPDGRAVVFHKAEDQVTNLWKQAVDGGEPVRLTDFKTDLIFTYAYSRDGRQLLLSRGKRNVTSVLIKNFRSQ